MKIHYCPETDSLYLELKAMPSAETHEVANGLNIDLDDGGDVVGFHIDHASKRTDGASTTRCAPRWMIASKPSSAR